MKRFEFIQPSSVEEALAAWEPGAAWLGGGRMFSSTRWG